MMMERSSSVFGWAAAVGVAAAVLLDVAREVLTPVQPQLLHSPQAKDVARLAKEAGACEPWRQSFAFLGRWLSGHAQTIAYGVSWRSPPLDAAAMVRDRWQTPDGGSIEVVWPAVELDPSAARGVALILPGLGGSVEGSGHSVAACAAVGLLPCVFHQRGDGGAPLGSPRFNVFGDTRDLGDAVERVRAEHALPVVLYATSAGTGILVRYLGERGADAPVAAAWCNNPGYDIGCAMTRCGWLYDSAYYLWRMKRHYLGGPNRALLEAFDADALRACLRARTLHEFMVGAAPFAGAPTFGEYLLRSNPIGTAHNIRIPILILNADDDPVCSVRNVDDHINLYKSHPTAVLCRVSRGGHCGNYASGFWSAVPWGHHLGARFLAAAIAAGGPGPRGRTRVDDRGGL